MKMAAWSLNWECNAVAQRKFPAADGDGVVDWRDADSARAFTFR